MPPDLPTTLAPAASAKNAFAFYLAPPIAKMLRGPWFCILDRQISRCRRASYFRDYSNFDVDQYIKDVDAVDWISVCNESNVFMRKLPIV